MDDAKGCSDGVWSCIIDLEHVLRIRSFDRNGGLINLKGNCHPLQFSRFLSVVRTLSLIDL